MLQNPNRLYVAGHSVTHSRHRAPISSFVLELSELDGMEIGCGVSLEWRLRGWKSTVRLGLPDFLGQMTIWWHQVTGVPTGTGSITPRRTS